MERLAEFAEAAREEFDEAFNWYAKRSHSAATGFDAAVDLAIERILADAGRFPRIHSDFQYCRVEKYPYSVIYRRSKDGVSVVAIAHAKRRPTYWLRRG